MRTGSLTGETWGTAYRVLLLAAAVCMPQRVLCQAAKAETVRDRLGLFSFATKPHPITSFDLDKIDFTGVKR